MVPPVGLLLLFPLFIVLLGPVLIHLSWEEATPPDVELVLAQLTLKVPLLGMSATSVVFEFRRIVSLVNTPWPGAGVADVEVDSLNM